VIEMPEPKAQWSWLIYIAAHNNLDALGQRSLEQILGVGSTPRVKLAVLYDGTSTAARYLAGEPGTPAVDEPLGAIDSGDPNVLLAAARWVFEQQPAECYGLVLWSHGSGWRPEEIQAVATQARTDAQVDALESNERAALPGSLALFRPTLTEMLKKPTRAERAICFDDGTGHSLDTLELERIMTAIKQDIGQPLDLLGMDACLMASLEVATQLRSSVRHLVASQELVPGFSWPYDQILGELRAKPEQSARDLAVSVVQRYTEYYTAHPPAAGDVTKVALDLSSIDALIASVDELAGALQEDITQQADIVWQAQLACHRHESRKGKRDPNKFRFHLWDVGSLAARLAATSSNPAVTTAAERTVAALRPGSSAVLAEGHDGEWFDGIGGVSIYLVPPNVQRISPYYGQLALAQSTRWGAMLDAYHEHFSPD
jgi:hypothetical protein